MAENISFADFVKEAREKKKKEQLAQEILGSRGRNANGAGSLPNTRNNSQKVSLLSRMSNSSGISKSRSSSAKPSPSIDGKWQHDLHKLNNPHGPPSKMLNRTASASQIDRNTRTFEKFRSTLTNNTARPEPSGFNIRGVATTGPYTIVASNFAPGTTAADIEAVMLPIVQDGGGDVLNCKVTSAHPTVMAELVVDRKEGGQNVIDTFNGKKADGRVLYVYFKDSSNTPLAYGRSEGRSGQSSYDDMDIDTNGGARSGSFQDGRFGFSENSRQPPRGPRRRF